MEFLPNEIDNIIKDYVIFKPKTKDELYKAVKIWCDNKEKALSKYGHISIWDTSLITKMYALFAYEDDFFNLPSDFLISISVNTILINLSTNFERVFSILLILIRSLPIPIINYTSN